MFDWIEKLSELKKSGKSFCLATIVKTIGSSPRKGGTRLIIESDHTFHGTIGGGGLENLVIEKAKELLHQNVNEVHNFPLDEEAGQVCGGTVDVLFESFGHNPKLYIFGAGHVGQAVSEIMRHTVFDIHVIDERDEWLNKLKYGTPHKIHFEEFIKKTKWDQNLSYAVAMTPDHAFDKDIALLLADKPLKYLGVIGSKSKWAHFKKKLIEDGLKESDISKIKSPIGVVKAGNEPFEIAISLGAELLDYYHNYE